MSGEANTRTMGRWALAVPAACAAAALLVVAAGGNQAVFLGLNSALQAAPQQLWAGLSQLGWAGSALAALSPLLWWLLRQGESDRARRVVLGLALGLPLSGIASRIVKETVQMDRPAAALAEGSFHIIGPVLKAVAFPSGHTVTAFAIAAVLVWAWRGMAASRAVAAASLGVASLIGLSRVAMGAHWPLDVCAGAALGWVCGLAGAVWAERWLTESPWVQRWWSPMSWALLGAIGLGLWLLPAEYAIVAPLQRLLGTVGLLVALLGAWSGQLFRR